MWSPELLRSVRALGITLVLPLVLAGCLRPLYGEAASGGTTVQAKLAGIVVDEVPDRIGHHLVEELRFDLDGSGATQKPRYRLSLEVRESVGSAIVSSVTGRAVGATVTANVTYTLTEIGTSKTILTGRTVASASYDRSEQRFAAVSAAKDAEIRIAKTLSDQIRTRIAAHFATQA
jgi:LPS-assembly lipoprotein